MKYFYNRENFVLIYVTSLFFEYDVSVWVYYK